jgi:hypothetical protein
MWGGPDLRYHAPHGSALPTLAELRGHAIPQGARIGDHEDALFVGWRSSVAATPRA